MAKRLVRAKYKIKAANIPYRVPGASDMPERLQSVLSGPLPHLQHRASRPGIGPTLRAEAIRLARLLAELMPDEPEAAGLLALMLLSEATGAGAHISAGAQCSCAIRTGRQVGPHDDRRGTSHRTRLHPPRPARALPAPGRDPGRALRRRLVRSNRLAPDRRSLRSAVPVMPTPVVALNRAIAIGEIERSRRRAARAGARSHPTSTTTT